MTLPSEADRAQCRKIVDAINEEVRAVFEKAPFKKDVRCVLLGGSYGRGEGGVFRRSDGTCTLYNDMDYFVITRCRSRRACRAMRHALRVHEARLTRLFGVDVEFGPPTPQSALPALTRTLMWNELAAAYEEVWGDSSVMRDLPWLKPENIPGDEAARLVMNRTMGYLMAEKRIELDPELSLREDRDFVTRNYNKAVLGLCDARLILQGHYAYHAVERRRQIAQYLPQLLEAYDQALEQKFAPVHFEKEPLLAKQRVMADFVLKNVTAFWQTAYHRPDANDEILVQLLSEKGPFPDTRSALERIKDFVKNLRDGKNLTIKSLKTCPRNDILLKIFQLLLEKKGTTVYINRKLRVPPTYAYVIKRWERNN